MHAQPGITWAGRVLGRNTRFDGKLTREQAVQHSASFRALGSASAGEQGPGPQGSGGAVVPAAGNQGNVGRKAGETVPEGKPVLQITDWPIGYSGGAPFEKSAFSKIFLRQTCKRSIGMPSNCHVTTNRDQALPRNSNQVIGPLCFIRKLSPGVLIYFKLSATEGSRSGPYHVHILSHPWIVPRDNGTLAARSFPIRRS
ncbi:predicted protein [Histoplasma capsulatum var. duboisii H88]|uniref:Predicted protein n=1 Tax=Ajellomyces capsulatus (strain H88) TaxID=544711 RepID=F0UGQ3_AJEC8|nr:predicted protein [Histoplasma capsulatum var. duboisii H88]